MSGSLVGLLLATLAGSSPFTGPPHTPAPDPYGNVDPPPGWVETARGAYWMTIGSFCWTDGGRGLCVDAAPPAARALEPVPVRAGERVTFHFGYRTRSVLLRRGVYLPAHRRSSPWWVRGRSRVLNLFVRAERGGDASYSVRLQIK